MLIRCKDGSYIVRATKDKKKWISIRLKPIDNAAVLLNSNKKSELGSELGIVVSILIILSVAISSLPYLLDIIIGIVIAILFIISLILSDPCKKINEWQKINATKFIYKQKFGFSERNVYSLRIGNEDYLIMLNNKDIGKLRKLGFAL